MVRFLLLLLLVLAGPATAASFVLPLAPDSPRPVMYYGIDILTNDGSRRGTAVPVEAVSGFAEVETSGSVADVRAMQFSFPAASFDLTVDAIPFSITIDATTERIEHPGPSSFSLASFGLALPGEQVSPIDPVQHLQRSSFGFTLQSAGTSFSRVGGADCESTGEPGCVTGGFTGTVDGFALTQLEFVGGTTNIFDASFARFALGTDALGISWTVWVPTYYPLEVPRGLTPPIVFTPEPGTVALLALGLLVLGARRRC